MLRLPNVSFFAALVIKISMVVWRYVGLRKDIGEAVDVLLVEQPTLNIVENIRNLGRLAQSGRALVLQTKGSRFNSGGVHQQGSSR